MLPRSIYKKTASRRDASRALSLISRGQMKRDVVLPGRIAADESNNDTQRGVMALHFLDAFVRAEQPRLPRSADRGRRLELSLEDVIINREKKENSWLPTLGFHFLRRILKIKLSGANFYLYARRKRVLRAMRNAISCNEGTTRELIICQRVYAEGNEAELKKGKQKKY